MKNDRTCLSYELSTEHQGLTVEEYLKNVLQISGRRIQKLTRKKGIFLNNKPVFLQKKVKAGDAIKVLRMEDASYGVVPEPGTIDILWEDEQVILLNKPAGLLVHPAGQTAHGTLANYLAAYYQQQGKLCTIRPLHRLDRDTSGCVAFAKDAGSQSQLEKQMQQGTFRRFYLALAEGIFDPPAGTIDAPIGRHPSKPNRRAVRSEGEKAVTHYRTISTAKGMSLLQLTLETGRTHQIRVHLASAGHPVVGDRMYGKSSPHIARQALHAESLEFLHPADQRKIAVTAPLPPDIAALLE